MDNTVVLSRTVKTRPCDGDFEAAAVGDAAAAFI